MSLTARKGPSKAACYSPDVFWVFVQFPGGFPTVGAYPEASAPRFFVLSSMELEKISGVLSIDVYINITIDGVYRIETLKAIKTFEEKNNLLADGYIDALSLELLFK